ncbi:hypothetical protein AeNC1_008119 [Aphanomyces euteiches]|nr:hypothetical protein AeNC1_008119 [Aphanomyces euteiches]
MKQRDVPRRSIDEFMIRRVNSAPNIQAQDRFSRQMSELTGSAPTEYAADVATLPMERLLQDGEMFAAAFLNQCGRMRHVSRRSRNSMRLGRGHERAKNVHCKYDSDTKEFTVHAVMDIQAGLPEVLHLLAGDTDPASMRHGFNVFLWRVFGSSLESATNIRSFSGHGNPDSLDPTGLLTMRKIPRARDSAVAIKQTSFVHSSFLRKCRAEWLLLDYVERRTDSSVVRVFKTVDNLVSYPLDHKGKPKERHTRLLFGFYVEELSFHRGGVCRVTFFGSHAGTKAHHPSHRLLQKLGESFHMMDLAVLRRRLGQHVHPVMPSAATAPFFTDHCVHCSRSSPGIVCRLCGQHVCSNCSSIEQVEATLRNIFELRVCGPCLTRIKARNQSTMPSTPAHVPTPKTAKAPPPLPERTVKTKSKEDLLRQFAAVNDSQRGMFRISEATMEGSCRDLDKLIIE